MLASLVLPAQILDYFLISGVEQTSQEIHISLDEKMNSKLSNDEHFKSKGFMEAVNVTDFPIRDHKVILKIRRRRWTDLRTGKSFSIPIDLDVVAKGTRYSKEFGAFLKEKPEVLTREEKRAWLDTLKGVVLGSDAFFPFGDNIERAHKSGVEYIAQAGGSVRDDHVIATCDKYGIAMAFTGIRLFHH